MGCLLYFTSLSVALLIYITTASHSRHAYPSPPRQAFSLTTSIPPLSLRQACHATRFPLQCLSSLTQSTNINHLPPNPTSLQIIQSAIAVSNHTLNAAHSNVNSLLHHSSTTNINRTMAVQTCLHVLHNSAYRISLANDALPRGNAKDARAWMSAALAYQYDCWSGLKYVYGNDTASISDTMALLEWLTGISSNALSMMVSYDVFGSDTATWKAPRTERDGFWERSSEKRGKKTKLGFSGGFPLNVKMNATVCKNGNGCYKTVQEAVNAAPGKGSGRGRFVIHIKAGVYEETVRIPIEKENVVFLGDGMGKTVITGSAHVGQPGVTTYTSATVAVLGDGFMAKNLTIQNTAGQDAHQAVAFRSDSDRSVLDSCQFIGNQDTLYAHSLRQFYKSCRIQGNVDFIFGNSASVFQDCEILVSPRQLSNPEQGENNAITAHGRTDPAQSTGFVFLNCVVNGTPEYMAQYRRKPTVHKNYLGRPWKQYSRTVFIDCALEALIAPEGWMPWDGDLGLNTLYYGEYGNVGPGSVVAKRVGWSSKIHREHVLAYSVSNFIQGSDWIPSFRRKHNRRERETKEAFVN